MAAVTEAGAEGTLLPHLTKRGVQTQRAAATLRLLREKKCCGRCALRMLGVKEPALYMRSSEVRRIMTTPRATPERARPCSLVSPPPSPTRKGASEEEPAMAFVTTRSLGLRWGVSSCQLVTR